MRRMLRILSVALGLVTLAAHGHNEIQQVAQSEADRTLYALGLALAESASRFELSAQELEWVVRGLEDGILQHELQVRLAEYAERVDALAGERIERAFQREERTGKAFRAAALAAQPGAFLTEVGAVVIPLRVGAGPTPNESSEVRVSYEGRTANGTVFDSAPVEERLQVVIRNAALPCLKEGLVRMQVGSRYRILCPPQKGFSPPLSKPGTTLVYDIELLEIVRKD